MIFVIEGLEKENYNKFVKSHKKKCKRMCLSYRFSETGIGLAIDVKCVCGVEKDITDYGSW